MVRSWFGEANVMTTQKSGGGAGAPGAKNINAHESLPNVDPDLQDTLGQRLREVYQEVVNEDVPDKFLSLLEELKRKETGGDSSP